MATLARHYLKPTALDPPLADRQQVDSTTPGGATDTGTSVRYTAASSGGRQFRPGTSVVTTVATVPAAGAIPANKWGWRQQLDITPEQVRTIAGSWPVSARFTLTGQTTGPTATVTFVAYLVSAGEDTTYTEIGRVAVPTGSTWVGGIISGDLAVSAVTGPLNSRIQIHVYLNVTTPHVGVGQMTVAISTNSVDSYLGAGTYTVLAERGFATTTAPAPDAVRGLTAARAGAVTSTPTVTRRSHVATIPKGVTTTPTVNRISLVSPVAKAVTTSPAVSNRKAVALIPKGVTTSPTTGMGRLVSAFRSAAVVASSTTNLARAVISARRFSVAATGTLRARLDIPTEALNRVGTTAAPDWPLTEPTKAISGVTRRSDGSPVGMVEVRLVRQSDDVRVASTTSDPTTGVYSFPRGADDPHSYYCVATKAEVPEIQGVTRRGLVPA